MTKLYFVLCLTCNENCRLLNIFLFVQEILVERARADQGSTRALGLAPSSAWNQSQQGVCKGAHLVDCRMGVGETEYIGRKDMSSFKIKKKC